jgi:hypothetical protein
MISQWMKNPCSHKQCVTTEVIVHARWSFLRLVVFCHLSKTTLGFVVTCVHYNKILSFAIKIIVVYFQISSNDVFCLCV